MNHPLIEAIARALDDLANETPTMARDRPYNGQPWTDSGERGKQMVAGLTMRDVRDCFVRAYILSHAPTDANLPYIREAEKGADACLNQSDMFAMQGDVDPVAVGQNLTCEIERAMGIFPNIDKLHLGGPSDGGEIA